MKITKIAQGRMDRNEEEMYSTTGEPLGKRGVAKIKDDIARLVDGFDENLMSKQDFELKMKELIRDMYLIKSDLHTQKNPINKNMPGFEGTVKALDGLGIR